MTDPVAKPRVSKRYYTRLMDLYRYAPVRLPVLNGLIRSLLRLRAEHARRALARRPVDGEALARWRRQHRFFFGFGVFRSGTTFMADFLNRAVPGAIVQHEPNVNDYYHYAEALRDERAAYEYIADHRLAEMYRRLERLSFEVYGELNPFLRRHCAALSEAFPEAQQFHIVRDGRDVVRSLMSREIFDRHDPMAALVAPPGDDPYRDRWPSMSRFEKVCWLWQADNRFMRERIGRTVQLEQILSSYDYLRAHLLEPLDLPVAREHWLAHTARVRNRTPRYRFPAFDAWEDDERIVFSRICGDEMTACGYTI